MTVVITKSAIAITATVTAIKDAITIVAMLPAVGQSTLPIKQVGFIAIMMLKHTIIALADSFKEVSKHH